MKSLHTVFSTLLFSAFLVTLHAEAGTRYRDIVFGSASVIKDIQYGSNMNLDGSNAILTLDVYSPAGDTVQKRPLVICIHGGSLVTSEKSEMGAFCNDLALRGYVAATINYRLGIEPPKGVKTIEEELLRGVQDTKAAVRFFRSKANDYGIDTSRIFLEGSSAGSMIAVHYAYWNQDEIPSNVDQVKWGNLEGASGNPGYSTDVKGIINYCGALLDPHWIDATDSIPVGNFHGLLDTVVPPDSGISGDFGIALYGGVRISRVTTQLGIYSQGAFFPLMGHGGNEDSLRGFSSNFFYSLMTITSTPKNSFTSMNLSSHSFKVFRYDTYTFSVTAYDPAANTVILPSAWIQYSCDSKIGTIQPSGVFTPGETPDSGYVYATFNGTTDSCFVKTFGIAYFSIIPKFAVVDTLRSLQLTINTYDDFQTLHNLPVTMFSLTSTDPSVGTISSDGVFTAKKNGTTKIIALFGGKSDTSVVNVESASGIVSFDKMESLSGWTFSGDNLDSLSVTLAPDQKSEGSTSFKISYKVTYDPLKSNIFMIYLAKDLSVYGIPDSIYLDVKSDGRNHRLYYRFADVDSELYRTPGKKYLNNSTTFDLVNASISDLSPLAGGNGITFPLTLKRLEIQLSANSGSGVSTSGDIYIDNLRLKYPGNITDVERTPASPSIFRLEQNYPNPFNPSTVINFSITKTGKVRLVIYDILGREVRTLIDQDIRAGSHSIRFNATNLPSGMYFYRLQANDHNEVKKMVLLK